LPGHASWSMVRDPRGWAGCHFVYHCLGFAEPESPAGHFGRRGITPACQAGIRSSRIPESFKRGNWHLRDHARITRDPGNALELDRSSHMRRWELCKRRCRLATGGLLPQQKRGARNELSCPLARRIERPKGVRRAAGSLLSNKVTFEYLARPIIAQSTLGPNASADACHGSYRSANSRMRSRQFVNWPPGSQLLDQADHPWGWPVHKSQQRVLACCCLGQAGYLLLG